MAMYHEHLYEIKGFKGFWITDMGNVYHNKGILMTPLVMKDHNVYQNGNLILATFKKNNEYYYFVMHEKTFKKGPFIKLSLDLNKFYEATITLKWIEHKKYFPKNKKGIEEAIKWAEELEKLYYPN